MTLPDEEAVVHTKPFLEHLQDLRNTLIWSAAFLLTGMVVMIPAAPWVISMATAPLARLELDPGTFLQVLDMTGGLTVAMRVVLWGGLLVSAPFVLAAVGYFVFPGLTPRERRTVLWATLGAAGLFVAGVAMGYAVTLPVALRFMLRINQWIGINCEFVRLGSYVSFVLRLLIAFGLAFELPVVVVALGGLGILRSDQLREKRRHVIIVIMVIAMLLTPPDPVTLLLMAVPMAILYELCIWIIWLKERAARSGASCP